MTVSSDLIYEVLRQHEPDHILLGAAFADAATGLIDVGRLNQFLQRIRGRIRHIALSQVSPLAVPVMLEKGAAFAALGMLLPPYDTRTTLERLHKVIRAAEPSRVVALGDSFHRSHLAESLAEDDLAMLTRLQQGREWYWICGNHDPHLPACAGGTVCTTLTICGITLRHEPSENGSGREIAGHLHPVARIARRGSVIRRRCFATDGNRLVMPAFGAYAGGLNVLDEAFGTLFLRNRLEAWMMGRADVYPVLRSLLLPD